MTTAAGSAPTPSVVRTTTPGGVWRQLRLPLALAVLVLVTAFGVTFFRQRTMSGQLDPRSVSPAGSRAVAQLLRERGVAVNRVNTLPETPEPTTVFVPFAGDLSAAELRPLLSPGVGVNVVLVAPSGQLEVQGVDVTSASETKLSVRAPGCALGLAVTAGHADAGGAVYEVRDRGVAAVDTCYAAGGLPSLVNVQLTGNNVTIVGSAGAFTNDRLDEEGNAALALGLLDHGRPVTWVMRRAAGSASGDEVQGLGELLPDGVYWGFLQLGIAAVVAMVWRGRRLGPVVTEPLPVVVRAAEAVEGRGRLYAAGKARGRAAWNLRRSAQARLRTRFALPPDATSEALIEGAAARTRRAPGDVGRLLYGPDPVDDAGLVRLAADLDYLDSEVRRS